MAQAQDPANRRNPPPTREDRLKAALKANMARRKAQMRARAAHDEDDGRRDQNEESGN